MRSIQMDDQKDSASVSWNWTLYGFKILSASSNEHAYIQATGLYFVDVKPFIPRLYLEMRLSLLDSQIWGSLAGKVSKLCILIQLGFLNRF